MAIKNLKNSTRVNTNNENTENINDIRISRVKEFCAAQNYTFDEKKVYETYYSILSPMTQVINYKNRDLAEEYGGDEDCVNDPEWAEAAGIPQVNYDSYILWEFVVRANYDPNKAANLLNEYLKNNLNIDMLGIMQFFTQPFNESETIKDGQDDIQKALQIKARLEAEISNIKEEIDQCYKLANDNMKFDVQVSQSVLWLQRADTFRALLTILNDCGLE